MLPATDSWRCVCQRGISSKRAQANLAINVKIEDDPQGGLEGTKLLCAVLRTPEGYSLASSSHY